MSNHVEQTEKIKEFQDAAKEHVRAVNAQHRAHLVAAEADAEVDRTRDRMFAAEEAMRAHDARGVIETTATTA